jgi:hypothetical protein
VTVTLDGGSENSDGTATATVEVTDGDRNGLGGENLEVYIDQNGSLRATVRQYG